MADFQAMSNLRNPRSHAARLGALVAVAATASPGCAVIDRVALVGYDTEDVEFASAGATLRGTLALPDDEPAAGVVLIHGSGEVKRMRLVARFLAAEGVAVLTWDKRGVGESEGEYEGVENISARNLELLASDAAAAAACLDARFEGRLPIGYLGISQGGWIAPLAANKPPAVDFLAFCAGPACTVSEELHFSAIAEEDASFWTSHSKAEVAEYMRGVQYRADDVDPRASLDALSLPALWLYGADDHSIPVDLSIERIDELIAEGHARFEHRVYPDLEHGASATMLKEIAAWVKGDVIGDAPAPSEVTVSAASRHR